MVSVPSTSSGGVRAKRSTKTPSSSGVATDPAAVCAARAPRHRSQPKRFVEAAQLGLEAADVVSVSIGGLGEPAHDGTPDPLALVRRRRRDGVHVGAAKERQPAGLEPAGRDHGVADHLAVEVRDQVKAVRRQEREQLAEVDTMRPRAEVDDGASSHRAEVGRPCRGDP